jgi:hypothetical protein
MNPVLLFLLAAQAGAAPPPTPTPTPRLNILLSRSSAEAASPTGSLSDVAKRIKLKLPEGQPRVLTNQTVKQLAEGVELTTTQGSAGAGGYAPVGEAQESPKKAMWQQRYRAAVARVAELEAEVKRLEGEVSRLETDFYAHDDPAQRDGVIKPAWDTAVADLNKARSDLVEARSKPEEVLDEARRDGALPGWFRGLDQAGAAPGEGRPAPGRPHPPHPG